MAGNLSFISKLIGGVKSELRQFAGYFPGVARPVNKYAGGAARGIHSAGMTATLPVRSHIVGTMTGGFVGGAYNYMDSDYDSSNLTAQSVIKGAVLGAAAGFGVASAFKTARWGAKRAYRGLDNMTARDVENFSERLVKGTASRAWNITDKTARVAGGMINFAARHPLLAVGAVAAPMAAMSGLEMYQNEMYGQSVLEDNPYTDLTEVEMNTALNREAGAAEMVQQNAVMPMGRVMPARAMLMNSTQGLVQGLHRGRHR